MTARILPFRRPLGPAPPHIPRRDNPFEIANKIVAKCMREELMERFESPPKKPAS